MLRLILDKRLIQLVLARLEISLVLVRELYRGYISTLGLAAWFKLVSRTYKTDPIQRPSPRFLSDTDHP